MEVKKWKAIIKTETAIYIDAHFDRQGKPTPNYLITKGKFTRSCLGGCKMLEISSNMAVWEHVRDKFPQGKLCSKYIVHCMLFSQDLLSWKKSNAANVTRQQAEKVL